MDKTLQYSILKYRHSRFLEEVVNVGVVVLYPDESVYLRFYHPDRLGRLSSLYPDLSLPFIREVLRNFKNQAKKLSEKPSLGENLDDILATYFIQPDESAFFFTKSINVLHSDVESFESYLYNRWLSPYFNKDREALDESELQNRFLQDIEKQQQSVVSKIKSPIILHSENYKHTFDLTWKNGHTNIVQPVSFDLVKPESIEQKGIRWYGTFNLLRRNATENDCKFDLLVSYPHDRKLNKAVKKSLDIIKSSKVNLDIIPAEEIDSYAHQVVRYLVSSDNT